MPARIRRPFAPKPTRTGSWAPAAAPALAPGDGPMPVPPALSPRIHGLLAEWEGLRRAPYPRDSAGREDCDAFDQRCARMDALLRALAEARALTPLDTLAKMTVLCRLLREGTEPADRTTQTLATACQESLTLLTLLASPLTDERELRVG